MEASKFVVSSVADLLDMPCLRGLFVTDLCFPGSKPGVE